MYMYIDVSIDDTNNYNNTIVCVGGEGVCVCGWMRGEREVICSSRGV